MIHLIRQVSEEILLFLSIRATCFPELMNMPPKLQEKMNFKVKVYSAKLSLLSGGLLREALGTGERGHDQV